MQIRFVVRLACVALALATPALAHAARGANAQAPAEKPAQANNAFAADLYARLAAGADGNVFFSPASVRTAMAIAWAGARGRTAGELATALHFPAEPDAAYHHALGGFLARIGADSPKGGYELAAANGLWLQRGHPFGLEYLAGVKLHYGATLEQADFVDDAAAAQKAINAWAAERTHDRIKDLMPPDAFTRDTRLVIANTIYFNGKWQSAFDPVQSAEDQFRTAGGKRVKATLMYQRGSFRYGEDDGVQVLDIPYVADELCLRVFLPRRATGLAAVEQRLTAERLAGLAAKLKPADVRVWLPRFTITEQCSLSDVFKAMGATLAFDGRRADFSGISSTPGIYLSAVVHKAFVKVDEAGTEAAAATGIVGGLLGGGGEPPKPKEFRADHAFAFAIVHRATDAILFMGRLSTP